MTRRFWLAVAAYVAPTFPLGYFWHLSVFKAEYDALGLYRADVLIPLGLASMLLQGLIFAYLYPRLFGAAHADWRRGAMQFFVVFGALAWSFLVLPTAAKYNMASVPRFMALETAFTILHFAVVSPLIAWIWRAASVANAAANERAV